MKHNLMRLSQPIAKVMTCTVLIAATVMAGAPLAQAANGDGQLDTTFGFSGLTAVWFDRSGDDYDDGRAVAVQADGKIVVAGTISYDNGVSGTKAIGVARLLPDGTGLDTTFGSAGEQVLSGPQSYPQHVTGIALQADGKILLCGWIDTPQQYKAMLAYRLDADGTPDASFGTAGRVTLILGTVATEQVLQVLALQSDGKIVGAGWIGGSISNDFLVIRLNTDGSLDTSFNSLGANTFGFNAGNGNDDRAYALAIDRAGNILLAGSATTSDGYHFTEFAAARFNKAGVVDTPFGSNGGVLVPVGSMDAEAHAVAVSYVGLQPLYTLAGFARVNVPDDFDFAAAQLDTYGTVTSGFGANSYAIDLNGTGADYGTAIIAENNTLFNSRPTRYTIGGYAFNSATGNYDFAALRVLANGAPDPTFGPDNNGRVSVAFDLDAAPSTHDDFGHAMALQGHRVIIAGTVGRQGHNGADADFGVTRLTTEVIFENGFKMP